MVLDFDNFGKVVNEMGIDLTRSGKESYLGKAAKASLANKQDLEEFDTIFQDFKNLRWQDLSITASGGSFYFNLPQALATKLTAFRVKNSTQAAKFGKWYNLDRSGVHMNRDAASSFQRSHFPDGGLPDKLKGSGLGYKCYRSMLQYSEYLSSNTGGTNIKNNAWASVIKKRPDPDDVHAIVGPENVLAMIKTLTTPRKIELSKKFINEIILPNINNITEHNFAIDDDLKAVLPPDVLDIVDPARRVEVQRRKEEADRVQAEQRAATELERNRATYTQFGIADIDMNFAVGDFVMRHTYINENSAKPRIIIRKDGNLHAISIQDYINASMSNSPVNSYQFNTIRPVNDSTWTKINILEIPNVNTVRLDTSEINLVNILRTNGLRTAPALGSEDARAFSIQASRRQQDQRNDVNYGPTVGVYDTAEYLTVLNNRTLRPETARKLKQAGFVERVFLTPAQYERFQRGKSTEVFAPFNGNTTVMRHVGANETPQKAINTITGFITDNPNTAGFAAKFELSTPRDKREFRAGDMVYIANHPEYFGITAQVGYSAHNAAQQAYVYVRIFNPAAGRGIYSRAVAIDLQFIKKMRLIP